MVAQHYRWDFIGLSTDTKPDSTNPKVANGSTYYESDTSKLYVWYNNQWYEKTATGGYELPIASASTLGGVKVGEGLSIDSTTGVLSASGGGDVTYLSSADYDFPDSNPDGIALWRLPDGIYFVNNDNETEIDFYEQNVAGSSSVNCQSGKFDVFSSSGYKICKFEITAGGEFYMGYTKSDTSGNNGVVKWYPDAS